MEELKINNAVHIKIITIILQVMIMVIVVMVIIVVLNQLELLINGHFHNQTMDNMFIISVQKE